jgi:hypothetical protein
MKTVSFIFAFLLGLTVNLFSGEPQINKNLFGHWILSSAETNGRPNSPYLMDRTFEYTEDGLFEGTIFINGEEKPFNKGKFFLPDDSTMICIHSFPENKLSSVSYTYNFHITGDSLHLYGNYFSNIQNRPDLLQMNFINEWWVKVTPNSKK